MAQSTIPELASSLRPALLRLTRLVRNQRTDLTVTLTQLSALGTLRQNGPMGAGELASRERVQPPSMTKTIAALEQRGLVVRENNANDRRCSIIGVTDEGIALLDAVRRERDAWLSRRLAVLTAEERNVLQQAVPLLERLAEHE